MFFNERKTFHPQWKKYFELTSNRDLNSVTEHGNDIKTFLPLMCPLAELKLLLTSECMTLDVVSAMWADNSTYCFKTKKWQFSIFTSKLLLDLLLYFSFILFFRFPFLICPPPMQMVLYHKPCTFHILTSYSPQVRESPAKSNRKYFKDSGLRQPHEDPDGRQAQ